MRERLSIRDGGKGDEAKVDDEQAVVSRTRVYLEADAAAQRVEEESCSATSWRRRGNRRRTRSPSPNRTSIVDSIKSTGLVQPVKSPRRFANLALSGQARAWIIDRDPILPSRSSAIPRRHPQRELVRSLAAKTSRPLEEFQAIARQEKRSSLEDLQCSLDIYENYSSSRRRRSRGAMVPRKSRKRTLPRTMARSLAGSMLTIERRTTSGRVVPPRCAPRVPRLSQRWLLSSKKARRRSHCHRSAASSRSDVQRRLQRWPLYSLSLSNIVIRLRNYAHHYGQTEGQGDTIAKLWRSGRANSLPVNFLRGTPESSRSAKRAASLRARSGRETKRSRSQSKRVEVARGSRPQTTESRSAGTTCTRHRAPVPEPAACRRTPPPSRPSSSSFHEAAAPASPFSLRPAPTDRFKEPMTSPAVLRSPTYMRRPR